MYIIYCLAGTAGATLPSYQDISPAKYPITANPVGYTVTTQVGYNT